MLSQWDSDRLNALKLIKPSTLPEEEKQEMLMLENKNMLSDLEAKCPDITPEEKATLQYLREERKKWQAGIQKT